MTRFRRTALMRVTCAALCVCAVCLLTSCEPREPGPPDASLDQDAILAGDLPDDDSSRDMATAEESGDEPMPGEDAALAAAAERNPEFHYEVHSHSDDWEEVVVFGGPDAGEPALGIRFEWDGEEYAFVSEGPIPAADEEDEEVPFIFQPSEEVALEAALTEQPDWLAEVQSHSDDWTEAVIWIGPPNSEWVFELALTWNSEGRYYDVETEEVGYPE